MLAARCSDVAIAAGPSLMSVNGWLVVMSGSLQIRRSVESDEGKYECVAENNVGLAVSYGAYLYVRGKYHVTWQLDV